VCTRQGVGTRWLQRRDTFGAPYRHHAKYAPWRISGSSIRGLGAPE
jgi:hypothetical protein